MNEAFEQLVYGHLMGELTESERVALAVALDSSRSAREVFVSIAQEETALRECLADMPSALNSHRAVPKKIVTFRKQRSWWPAAIAACLAMAIGALLWFPGKGDSVSAKQSIARIAGAIGSGKWKVGDVLRPGIVEVRSGELELLFHSGTSVVLLSPCRVKLSAARSCEVLDGRVLADVPESDSGFAIDAPGMRVVDIGTRFGIDTDGEASELHVLEGKVIATPEGGVSGQYILERHAVRAASGKDAKLTRVGYDADRFTRLDAGGEKKSSAYLHYSFDEAKGRKVLDHGKGLSGSPFPARIEKGMSSAFRAPGRFGSALALDGQGMILRSAFKGIPGSAPRSIAMWVKLPAIEIPSAITRSLASWGQPTDSGAQWLFGLYHTRTGESICTEFTGSRVQSLTSLNDGQWHHIASVYDGDGSGEDAANRIEHYIDGQLSKTLFRQWMDTPTQIDTMIDSPDSLPLILGLHPTHTDATTQVLIDEFFVFDNALKATEIEALYHSNSPPTPK